MNESSSRLALERDARGGAVEGWRFQRAVGWLLAPVWLPAVAVVMRVGLGYRIAAVAEVRRQYRDLCRGRAAPLVICANHLTMIDSAIIAWALASPWWYLRHYAALPWNMPERLNFAHSWPARVLAYVMKCVPVTRGGARAEVTRTVDRFCAIVAAGDVGLLFPEGGRGRTGRIQVEEAAYGVGHVVNRLPGCEVLCVYARGDHQTNFSWIPARGERFAVEAELLQPQTTATGLRADRDVTRQIIGRLAAMEQRYFDAR